MGSAAAAISAAIFGPAALASFDQPAVSRILTKLSAPAPGISAATSVNSGASCVQATVIGLAAGRRLAEALQFGAAELASFDDLGIAAGAADRGTIEHHGVVAGTDQDFARPLGHLQH